MNQDNWAQRISRAMEARLAGEELRRDQPPRLTRACGHLATFWMLPGRAGFLNHEVAQPRPTGD